VEAPPSPSRATLYAICGQCVGQEIITINPDKITKNFKSRKTKYFAKLVLSCSLRSHHKTKPHAKNGYAIFGFAHPPPKARNIEQNLVKNFFLLL
jgi:hypothetical protein